MFAFRTDRRIFVLPLIVVILLLGWKVLGTLFADRDRAELVESRTYLAERLNDIVHQLQRERGYSSGYLASDGRALTDELAAQRRLTDEVVGNVVSEWAVADGPRNADVIEARLDELQQWRTWVDAQSIARSEVVDVYTAFISDLLEAAELNIVASPEDRLRLLIEASQALAQAKDTAGLQRATGAAAFASQDMDAELHLTLVSLAAQEAAFLELAEGNVQGSGWHLAVNQSENFAPMDRVRRDLIAAGYGGSMPDISAESWFALSSDWINALRRAENQLASEIADLSREAAQTATSNLISNGLQVVLALLFVFAQVSDRPGRAVSQTPTQGAA